MYEVKEIARAAKIYSDAAFQLNQSVKLGQDDLLNLLPSQVLAALSLELYLKTIYCIDKGSNISGHDLESIFNRLDESTKDFIIAKYKEAIQGENLDNIKSIANKLNIQADTSFLSMLKHWNGIFVDARYFYENRFANKLMFLYPELKQSLVGYILEKRPDLVCR